MGGLRLADRSDIPDLTALIGLSARGLSREWYTAGQTEALIREVFGVDTQLLEDQTYYLIEEKGQIVACGGWSHRRALFGGDQTKNDTDSELDPAVDPARIRAFFVHPAAARQGLGRRLLEHCENEARRAGFSRCELMATLPGVPFYRRAGYRELKRVSYPLRGADPVEFVRMDRSLT